MFSCSFDWRSSGSQIPPIIHQEMGEKKTNGNCQMDHVDWYLLKDTVALDFITESIKTVVNNNNTINTTGLHLTDKRRRLFWKSAEGAARRQGGNTKAVPAVDGGCARLQMQAGNSVIWTPYWLPGAKPWLPRGAKKRRRRRKEWNPKWPGFIIMWRKWSWLNLWLGRMNNSQSSSILIQLNIYR